MAIETTPLEIEAGAGTQAHARWAYSAVTAALSTNHVSTLALSSSEASRRGLSTTVEVSADEAKRYIQESGAARTTPVAAASVGEIRVAGMHKWQGRIIEVGEDTFTAELRPMYETGPDFHADFDIARLTDGDDRESVKVGDIFYVTVRIVKDAGAHSTQTSSLRLKRIGKRSEEEISSIHAAAKRMKESIDRYAE